MATIKNVKSIKVLNSRGDWTIKTYLELDDGSKGWGIVPEGASKGEHEAVCLETDRSIEVVRDVIIPKLLKKGFKSQKDFDEFLISLDGTSNKSKLGGNSLLSLSIAFSRAHAKSSKLTLWNSVQNDFFQISGVGTKDNFGDTNITPLFNILNGGKHAQNDLSFQEFMVIPAKKFKLDESLEIGRKIYKTLKKKLEKDGFSTGVGDEGGFAPEKFTVKKSLEYIKSSIAQDYKVGEDVFIGMDVAAESFYINRKYKIDEEKLELDSKGLKDYYYGLLKYYEIIYIEDPFFEEDHTSWQAFTKEFGGKFMISADDLVVTNPSLLSQAVSEKLANTVIVKPNQVGTVWETLLFVAKARAAKWNVVVSHRSGDTEDPFIADLACAIEADFVKFGALDRGERTSKFNRLLELSMDSKSDHFIE